ncbi:hypothetical protein HHX47_DHR6000405 [Lentinula edodes]|nr:hypothetical protein HHX47_DHR6000405 [Lentinula edodes]
MLSHYSTTVPLEISIPNEVLFEIFNNMEGRLKEEADEIDLEIDPDIRISGAKLKCISQSLAQKFIRQKKMKTKAYQNALNRRATACGIGRAKACAKETFGFTPTTEAIWKSTRHKDLGKKIRAFLWMLLHSGYKIGEYWEKIPGFESRATCTHCNTSESMEHILIDCQAPGQKEVWELTKRLWEKTGVTWKGIEFGNILSCGLADFKDAKGKRKPEVSRLFRILISESSYLIWKLRCERVIGGKNITKAQITNQWTWTVESRLNLDCLLTSKKFSTGKISKEMIKKTWGKLVMNKDQFFETLEDTGVLRQHLGKSIRGFHIRWQIDVNPSSPCDFDFTTALEKLEQVLRSGILSSLESLELWLGPANRGVHPSIPHIIERMILGSHFRQLTSCSLGAEWAKGLPPYSGTLDNFLGSLQSLRHLKLHDHHAALSLPSVALPILSSFRGSPAASASLLPGRPIQYLSLIGDDYDVNQEILTRFAKTTVPLRVLDLSGMSVRPILLRNLATHLPSIEVLKVRLALRHTLHYALTGIVSGLRIVLDHNF